MEVMATKPLGNLCLIVDGLYFGKLVVWSTNIDMPIYAEQHLNTFRTVMEIRLVVKLRLDYKRGDDLVMAGEIEKGLKKLMDRNNMVHKRVKERKEMARKVVPQWWVFFQFFWETHLCYDNEFHGCDCPL